MSSGELVPKSRRRQVPRSPRNQVERSVKVGLYLSLDAARRLGVTATMEGRDRSQIVDELIRTHLRKYVVQIRPDRASDGADPNEFALD
jgi:hypothetical protein